MTTKLKRPPCPAGVTEAQWILAWDMPEADCQRKIIGHAKDLGYEDPYHTQFAIGSTRGFPDLVCANLRSKRLVHVEIKDERRSLTVDQRKWRDWIIGTGGEWYLWRPRHLLNGTVDEILALPCKPAKLWKDIRDD